MNAETEKNVEENKENENTEVKSKESEPNLEKSLSLIHI